MAAPKETLLALVDEYFSGRIAAQELINSINDLVGDDVVRSFSHPLENLVLKLQDELSLYVRDMATRSQYPDLYFGEEGLRERLTAFRKDVGML